MMPPLLYKTLFVRRRWWDRGRELFTKHLEDALNALAREGWEITRYDNERSGVLIIGRKLDTEAMKKNMPDENPVMAVVPFPIRPPSSESQGMSPPTLNVVRQILARLDGEGVKDAAEFSSKIFKVVESVCRGVPNPILRNAVNEIRTYSRKHREQDHGGDPNGCDMNSTLEGVVVAMEKHIAQSVV